MMPEEIFHDRLEKMQGLLFREDQVETFVRKYEALLEMVRQEKAEAVTKNDICVVIARLMSMRLCLHREAVWLSGVKEFYVSQGLGHGQN